jgi:hypothetical protein
MSTITTSYGIKAVGRAAAATVLLPLAIGIDLIILPGPQVRVLARAGVVGLRGADVTWVALP